MDRPSPSFPFNQLRVPRGPLIIMDPVWPSSSSASMNDSRGTKKSTENFVFPLCQSPTITKFHLSVSLYFSAPTLLCLSPLPSVSHTHTHSLSSRHLIAFLNTPTTSYYFTVRKLPFNKCKSLNRRVTFKLQNNRIAQSSKNYKSINNYKNWLKIVVALGHWNWHTLTANKILIKQ